MAFLLLFFCTSAVRCQIAGLGSLALFDQSSSARAAGLGMDYLALFNSGLGTAIDNPALLHSDMSGEALVSIQTLFDGGSFGSMAYAHHFSKVGTFGAAFKFNNYGRFEAYDAEERDEGTFSAADYALQVSYAMWLDSCFSVGVSAKPVLSQYESYKAFSLLFDVSIGYSHPGRNFAAAVMLRNVGTQLSTFDGKVARMPYELSAALSYKLKRAPFRFYFAATELQRWDLRFDDPLNPTSETDPFTGQMSQESGFEAFADKLMRHVQLGVELSIGKPLFVRVGYNYRQAMEMRGSEALNLSGLAFGFGLRGKRFAFEYARRNYHLTQAPNYFTFSYRF